jgi:hypothetical protein
MRAHNIGVKTVQKKLKLLSQLNVGEKISDLFSITDQTLLCVLSMV